MFVQSTPATSAREVWKQRETVKSPSSVLRRGLNHKNGKQEVSYCTKVRSYSVPGTLAGPSSLHAFIIHKEQGFSKGVVCLYYVEKVHSGTTRIESSLLFWHMRRSCAFCRIHPEKSVSFIDAFEHKSGQREQRKQTKTTPSRVSQSWARALCRPKGMNKWFTELRPKWKYYSGTRHMRVCLH